MPLGPCSLWPHSPPLPSGTSQGPQEGSQAPRPQAGPQCLEGASTPCPLGPDSFPPAPPHPIASPKEASPPDPLDPEHPNHTRLGSQRCHSVSNTQGHFCQPGAAWPAPCHRGEYQPSLGADTCLPCPPGSYCPRPSTRVPRLCPAHAYCPAGMPRSPRHPPFPQGPPLSSDIPLLPLTRTPRVPTAGWARHPCWEHQCGGAPPPPPTWLGCPSLLLCFSSPSRHHPRCPVLPCTQPGGPRVSACTVGHGTQASSPVRVREGLRALHGGGLCRGVGHWGRGARQRVARCPRLWVQSPCVPCA